MLVCFLHLLDYSRGEHKKFSSEKKKAIGFDRQSCFLGFPNSALFARNGRIYRLKQGLRALSSEETGEGAGGGYQ